MGRSGRAERETGHGGGRVWEEAEGTGRGIIISRSGGQTEEGGCDATSGAESSVGRGGGTGLTPSRPGQTGRLSLFTPCNSSWDADARRLRDGIFGTEIIDQVRELPDRNGICRSVKAICMVEQAGMQRRSHDSTNERQRQRRPCCTLDDVGGDAPESSRLDWFAPACAGPWAPFFFFACARLVASPPATPRPGCLASSTRHLVNLGKLSPGAASEARKRRQSWQIPRDAEPCARIAYTEQSQSDAELNTSLFAAALCPIILS